MLDAGLDLGKTAAQSLTLLRGSAALAGLGFPLLLSASNKTFLGVLLDLDIDRAPRRPRCRRPPWGSRWAAGCCASTTWPAPAAVRDALAAVAEAG